MSLSKVLTIISLFAFASTAQAKLINPTVQLKAEFEQPVLQAGESQRAIIKISLLPEQIKVAEERLPVNLAIALDKSGSMRKDKIVQAQNAVLKASSLLGPKDRFSLVTYSDEAETLIKSQQPLEMSSLASIVRTIRSKGSTALYAGVSQAAAEIRRGQSEGAFNRLILLSDGNANKGPSSIADLSGLSRSLAGEDISVSTVGLGADFNEDLMTAMAETAQGNAYFAENSNDLTRIFTAELEDVLNVAATNIQIIVECAPGARPIRIIGRDGVIDDNTVSMSINHLFGGQEKYALIEVNAPAGKDGDISELMSVHIKYQSSISDHPISQSTVATVTYSSDDAEAQKAANVEVTHSIVENRIAEVKREAITLSDRGANKQAAQIIQNLQSEVIEMNLGYNDTTLMAQVESLDGEAQKLEKSRLSNVQRKAYSNSSYQIMNQQKSID